FYRDFQVQRPDDETLRRDEAEQWFSVGYIEQVLGQTSQAQEAFQRAEKLLQLLVKAHPRFRKHLAATHYHLGILCAAMGNREEALKEFEHARDLWRTLLLQGRPESPEYLYYLAGVSHNLADLLFAMGKREEARMEYERARELFLHLVNANPDLPEYQHSL